MAQQAAAPPDYHQATGNTGPQSAVNAVLGPSMASYQTAAGPIYVQQVPNTYPQVIHTIPKAFMPNDYLAVTILILVICTILNITSLALSLPALLCSILTISKKQDGNYLSAKKFGYATVILDIICVTYTLTIAFTIVFIMLSIAYIRI